MYSNNYERSHKSCNAQCLCCKHFKGVPKKLPLLEEEEGEKKEEDIYINLMVKHCFSHTELHII